MEKKDARQLRRLTYALRDERTHFKMYKAGKKLAFASITTLGFATAMTVLGAAPVHADTASPDDGQTATATVAPQTVTSGAVALQHQATSGSTSSAAAAGSDSSTSSADSAVSSAATPVSATSSAAAGSVTPGISGSSAATSLADKQYGSSAATSRAASAPVSAAPTSAATVADATTTSLDLHAEQDTIKSGQTAAFDLNLNVSGITTDGQPQQLVVDLPDDFTLATGMDLSINGVTPTSDSAQHQLVYNFATPQNGLTVAKRFTFATQSGSVVNGTLLQMRAQFIDGSQITDSGLQTVTVTSKAVYGVASQFDGVMPTDGDGNLITDANGNATIDTSKASGRAGDLVVYTVGVTAPKQTLGQAYLEPGTVVQVAFMLPKGLTFKGVDSTTLAPNVTVNADGTTTLRFYFEAPSIAEQAAAVNNLVANRFNILAQINGDLAYNTSLTTQALMGATSINGEAVKSSIATTKIVTVPDFTKSGIPTDGSEAYFYTWGPADGNGKLSTYSNANDDPQVGVDAQLQFRLQLGTADYIFGQADNSKSHLLTSPSADIKYTSEGWIRELQKYEATYDIDDHLNVNQLYVGAPNAWIEGHPYALTEDPKFNLYVQYRGEMDFESTPIITGMTDTAGQWVDLSSLLDNARGVDKLRFEWTTLVAGQNYSNICFMMTPKAGYYGTVGNRLTVNIAGYCGLGWVETQYDENGAYVVAYVPHIDVHEDLGAEVHMLNGHGNAVRPGDDYDQRAVFNQYMTTKTAEIVRPAENTPRVLNESLSFANQTAGKVDVGANQLVVTVENNKAALQSFDGLVSYVILPEGVAYTGNDAQVTASEQDGKTLLTIHWKRDALAPNSVNRLTLPVTVAATLNATQLAVTINSTVNQADTVVPRTIDPTDASDVQILANVTDILGTPINQKVYALTLVTPVNDDGRGAQLQSTALAANAAGDEGALVTVRAGEDGQYLLRFAPATSAVLQDVTIHVTLPYVGDQAELSATSRGTTTNDVHLAGPVQLPTSWAGKATARYITAAAPTGLVAADVTNFADVTGLLVTFNDPAAYLDGGAQTLILPVHVADAATPGTQAYVSAAVSANGLSAAEGLRAGITVGVHQQASATVTYHDDTTDTDLRTVTAADDPTLTGFVGTTSAYDATPVIDEYLQAGYGLASDGTKDANGTRLIAFTTDGATTNYVVHLYHNFVADKPTTSSQTIHYVDQHQQPLAPDHVDTVSFLTVRDMVTDASQSYVTLGTVTGQPVVNDGVPTGEWLVGTTADLAAVANPVITNYRVVATTAANGDLVAVPATTLMATSGAQVVTVSYDFATGEPGTSAAAGPLTIRYVNRYGMQLRPATTQTGYVGNGYSVTAPTLTGYTYVGPAKDSAALTGTFINDPTTITLVYDLIQGQPGTSAAAGPLTIRYVNRYGMQLRAATTQTGYVGNGYSVTAPTLTDYTYVGLAKDSAALTGTFTSDPTTITLVYDLIQGQPGTSAVSGPLTVRIVDQVGQPLRPALVRTDFVGNGYHVTVPTINGYDYVGLAQGSAALWGTFVATPTTITLVYRQQEQPGTPTPPRRHLPDTGTTSTPTAPTSSPRLVAHTTGTRVTPTPTTRAGVATNRPTTRTLPATGTHRTLPQTGDQTVRSGATLSVLGLGLLSLLSGLWFRKREH